MHFLDSMTEYSKNKPGEFSKQLSSVAVHYPRATKQKYCGRL